MFHDGDCGGNWSKSVAKPVKEGPDYRHSIGTHANIMLVYPSLVTTEVRRQATHVLPLANVLHQSLREAPKEKGTCNRKETLNLSSMNRPLVFKALARRQASVP